MANPESEYADCVERWLLGDDESFEQVFHQHYRLVAAFFARRGFAPVEAEDLAQEVFIRVYKSRASFRGEARFTTWLFQICSNLFRNSLRDRSAQRRDAAEVPIDSSQFSEEEEEGEEDGGKTSHLAASQEDPLNKALREEVEEGLRSALADLPPQMQRAVTLRIYQDLKYREIAEVMGVSIDTVKAYLFGARQILKQRLGDHFGDFTF